jgi:hypothetical protein
MLLVVLLVVTIVIAAVVTQAQAISEENHRTAFNRFCAAECVSGKHYRSNYNINQYIQYS